MKSYRLTANHTHGERECAPGDIIELTDSQALAFADRVEEVIEGEVIKNPEGEEHPQGPPKP